MGWWTTQTDDLVIGDGPADVLDVAIEKITGIYEKDIGRKPTVAELAALMRFCSGGVCNGVTRMRKDG